MTYFFTPENPTATYTTRSGQVIPGFATREEAWAATETIVVRSTGKTHRLASFAARPFEGYGSPEVTGYYIVTSEAACGSTTTHRARYATGEVEASVEDVNCLRCIARFEKIAARSARSARSAR
jgi:hypothetical protein